MAATSQTSTAGRSSSSPAWASSPRSAPARRTTGRSSPPASPASARITRFPTDGLKTTIAGTRRFRAGRAVLRDRRSASAWPRWPPRRRSPKPASARKGDFPGPLFLAVAPVEIEWPQREALARSVRRQRHGQLRRPAARRRDGPLSRHSRALPVRLGRRAPRRPLRHQGLADLAVDRLRLGRDRDPARRRGDPPRRDRRGALHRHRRLGQSGSADPLLAALRAVDRERSAASGGEAVLQEPRRLRHGRGRRRAGARELRGGEGARRQDPRRPARAAARWRIRSTAPARARTASRSSAASATRSPTPASRPTTSTTSTARHRHAGERQDGMPRRLGRVRRARQVDPDLVQQIDDRPHAVGGRRGRGGLLAAHAASTSAFRRPSTTTCPIRRSRSTWCRTWRATPSVRHAMSNSFGFGGQNVSLVMSREPA